MTTNTTDSREPRSRGRQRITVAALADAMRLAWEDSGRPGLLSEDAWQGMARVTLARLHYVPAIEEQAAAEARRELGDARYTIEDMQRHADRLVAEARRELLAKVAPCPAHADCPFCAESRRLIEESR